jgi:hypothetical protein
MTRLLPKSLRPRRSSPWVGVAVAVASGAWACASARTADATAPTSAPAASMASGSPLAPAADPGPEASSTDRCADLRRGLQRADDDARGKPPLDAFRTLGRYVDGIADDPTDCVSTEARHHLAAAEKDLVVLRAAGADVSPDRVVYCNDLVPATLVCNGPEADETALVDEAALARPPRPLPQTARLSTTPGYDGRILGVYAADRGALQDGKAPARVSADGGNLQLQTVRRSKGPVVIATVRRQDSLAFRKFVWYFGASP